MRSQEDAQRSLKRYVALALGSAWEVRLAREEGAFKRPFARVGAASAGQYPPGSQWVADVIQPFFVHLYPVAGATPDEAVVIAAQTEDLMFSTFRAGVAEGRPNRVPLYDYAGVGLNGGSVSRGPSDFMRVSDLSIGRVVDPDDDRLWAVVTDIRLNWRRIAAVIPSGGKVQSVTAEGVEATVRMDLPALVVEAASSGAVDLSVGP